MLAFLGWEDSDEESFAPDVRIVLVSEDFGKELTTAVLWLRERDIDIRCIRLRPYLDGERRLVDVQQVIPLPEAHEYQVQLREKEQVGRKQRAERYDLRQKFWEGLVALAQRRQTRHANLKPGPYHWLGADSGKVSESFGDTLANWGKAMSPGKRERLDYLTREIGLTVEPAGHVRYQLLHRAASALIEARRFYADTAVMLVHSFSREDIGWDDFCAFTHLFGVSPQLDELVRLSQPEKVPLYAAWVRHLP